MGVKNLHSFLKNKFPILYKKKHLSEYKNKWVSIDGNVYIYKIKKKNPKNWIRHFVYFVQMFLENGVKPCFVYDSKYPPEKRTKIEHRKEKKKQAFTQLHQLENCLSNYRTTGAISGQIKKILNNHSSDDIEYAVKREKNRLYSQYVTLTRADIQLTKDLLHYAGLPYFDSPCEAEMLCANLCNYGKTDFVLSEDSDTMLYGAKVFCTKLDHSGYVVEIQHVNLLKKLGFGNLKELLDFGILCGVDYNQCESNNFLPIRDCDRWFELIKTYKTIENIKKCNEHVDVDRLNYVRVREIFESSIDETLYTIDMKKVDKPELERYFTTNNIYDFGTFYDLLVKINN
jgi:flap endonuclease-1